MLTFLESSLSIDASNAKFGGMTAEHSVVATLTLDQRSTKTSNFIVTVLPRNTTPPFKATLAKMAGSEQVCLLTLTFDKTIDAVPFGKRIELEIKADSDIITLPLEVNYAVNSLDGIDLGAPLTTKTVNNRFRALMDTARAAFNLVKTSMRFYGYKERYLPDIIDFAVSGGVMPLSSNAVITRNAQGDIASIVTDFGSGRHVGQKIRVSYTYGEYLIKRMLRRDPRTENYTPVGEDTKVMLLNSLSVDVLNSSDQLIVSLGNVIINRDKTTKVNVPYLKDYDNSLDPAIINFDPGNQLSEFKYYEVPLMTGWTVVGA